MLSKSASVAALFIVLSSAQAVSFDLMLLPTESTGRVVRYDPVNRIALGAFGTSPSGTTTPRYVNMLDANRASLTTVDITSIHDVSTGATLDTADYYNNKARSAPGGATLWGANGATLSRFVFGAGGPTFISTNLLEVFSVVPISDSVCLAYGRDQQDNLVAATFSQTQEISRTTIAATGTFSHAHHAGAIISTTVGPRIILPARIGGVLKSATLHFDPSGNIAVSGTHNLQQAANFAGGATYCVLPAHTGYYLIGEQSGAPTATWMVQYSQNGTAVNWHSAAVDTPGLNWQAAIVLAPEPSGSALLLLGLGFFARRSR